MIPTLKTGQRTDKQGNKKVNTKCRPYFAGIINRLQLSCEKDDGQRDQYDCQYIHSTNNFKMTNISVFAVETEITIGHREER